MKNKRVIVIALFLLIIGVVQLYFYFSGSTPDSRRRIELSVADFSAESEFALDAVRSYYRDPRKFSRYWKSYGDIFQNAVKLLKERQLKAPEVLGVYRFKSSSDRIMVELGDGVGRVIVVMVWRGSDGQLAVSDISELE